MSIERRQKRDEKLVGDPRKRGEMASQEIDIVLKKYNVTLQVKQDVVIVPREDLMPRMPMPPQA